MVEIPAGNQEQKPDTKGVGILPKLLVLIGVIVLVLWALRGFEFNLVSLFNSVLMVGVAVVLFYLAWLGIKSLRQEKPFSPTDSLTNKFIRIAEMCKPDNVKELFLRGDDMRLFSKLGKITGLLFIPYLVSVPERELIPVKDENGKPVMVEAKHNEKTLRHDNGKPIMVQKMIKGNPIMIEKRNKFGAIEKDEYGKIIKIQKMKKMQDKNGDWLFVVQKGLFKEKMLIRAHHDLVSTVAEKMWILDVNVVPIGEYYYPSKQWAENIKRVTSEHQLETFIETHMHFLDLVSNISEATLSGNPDYLRMMLLNNEIISQRGGTLGGNQP